MCNPLTLHHNEHGYVTWCKNCDYVSVTFGNVMMAILPAQLRVFMKILEFDLRKYYKRISEGEKAFIYNSDSNCVRIILNYREVEQLDALLKQSVIMYEASRILDGDEV